MRATSLKLGILLASAAMALAQNNVLGMLSLPEVFGPSDCKPYKSSVLKLYTEPKMGRSIGSVRVDTHLKLHAEGGCDGPKVNVHRTGQKSVRELPVKEYEYEIVGAIVLDQRGRWFKVRLADGSAWLPASKQPEFHSLEELFKSDLTYVTEGAGGSFFPSPGASSEAIAIPGGGRAVRVLEFRPYGGQRWVNIEVMSHSICDSDEGEPRVTGRWWLPAYTPAGEPTIWFHPRGC